MNDLGRLLETKGDLDGAEPLCRTVLEKGRGLRGFGPTPPGTSGSFLWGGGGRNVPEVLLRSCQGRAKLGDDHENTIIYMKNLADLLSAKGDFGAAGPLYREALERSPGLSAGFGGAEGRLSCRAVLDSI